MSKNSSKIGYQQSYPLYPQAPDVYRNITNGLRKNRKASVLAIYMNNIMLLFYFFCNNIKVLRSYPHVSMDY